MLYADLKKQLEALPQEKLQHHVTVLVTNAQIGALVQGVDGFMEAGEALPGTGCDKMLPMMGAD